MPAAASSQTTPLASVPVLLWPPAHAADPALPRVDLLSFMLDPKKVVDAQYQMVEITADRIFFLRYPNLERDTQDWVRRELQECFAEQGCARSISIKEWAKQTTERQTPRLRLRCTKVCGFGFQVNFDMERQQYYVVRSRGKSGNFLHKCPAPVTEDRCVVATASAATTAVKPAPVVSTTPAPVVSMAPVVAPPVVAPQNVVSTATTETAILPKPEISASTSSGFGGMPPTAAAVPPPPPPADDLARLDDFALLIPSPQQNTTHALQQHPGQTISATTTIPVVEAPNMYAIAAPPATTPFASAAAPPPAFAAAAQTNPATAATTTVYFQPSQLSRDSSAQQGGEFHDMDVSSVDSTDMMIARHFGTGQSSGTSLSNSDMQLPGTTAGTRAASRMQVNNEAEYPTVGSIRSFLSMMTGSINSTLGKAWLARSTSNTNAPPNAASSNSNRDENMLTANSTTASSYLINTTGSTPPRPKSSGADPMDTVNSALSALSVSGMPTLGTMPEETAAAAGDGNPFSADFWNPPPPAAP